MICAANVWLQILRMRVRLALGYLMAGISIPAFAKQGPLMTLSREVAPKLFRAGALRPAVESVLSKEILQRVFPHAQE